MIEGMVRRLSRRGADLRSRLGVLVGKCGPLAGRLRPLWMRVRPLAARLRPVAARGRVLVLRVHGRIRVALDPEPRVRALAATAGAGAAAILATGTLTDTGLWFRQGRVCAACAGGTLFLLAPGRRPHVERIPFAQLGESMYNAITGEVLLAPAPDASVRRLRLDPAAGRRLIEEINTKEGEP